ncbi:hypothetical protein [Paenibacillus validus]
MNERSAEIGEIVTIIRDIASQTGLLSLNAPSKRPAPANKGEALP